MRRCRACDAPIHQPGRVFCSRACWRRWKINRRPDGTLVSTPTRSRPCEVCGSEFRPAPHRVRAGRGRYCSNACRGIAHRANPGAATDRTSWYQSHGWQKLSAGLRASAGACRKCGATGRLHVHHRRDPYPTRDVQLLLARRNLVVLCCDCHGVAHARRTKARRCARCRRQFRAVPGARYCSQACYHTTHARKPQPCAVCGASFMGRAKSVCCSRACAAKKVGETKRGRRARRKCPTCGTWFRRPPSQTGDGRCYCSRECWIARTHQ